MKDLKYRDPVNKQAAMGLSNGSTTGVTQVEDALMIVFGRLSERWNINKILVALNEGTEVVEVRVKAYKKPGSPGFAVRVYYSERDHETNPFHFTGLQ